jgi:hypothetical protein
MHAGCGIYAEVTWRVMRRFRRNVAYADPQATVSATPAGYS